MSFVSLYYDILYLYQVSSSYLSPFRRYREGHFDRPLVSNVATKTILQNILPRTMEWLKDATNALEQDDSVSNKGPNNSFWCLF